MRDFRVTLAQNLGDGTMGASREITSNVVDIGPWSWEVDKELTKLAAGQLTLRVADPDGSLWAWCLANLDSPAGCLPPWLTVDEGGKRQWYGVVPPDQLQLALKTSDVTLTSQDWSSQLASRYLGADRPEDDLTPGKNPWLRPYPKAASNRPSETKACWAEVWTVGGRWDAEVTEGCVLWAGAEWLHQGDLVTCELFPGQFKVRVVDDLTSIGKRRAMLGKAWGEAVKTVGWPWAGVNAPNYGRDATLNVTRPAATNQDTRAYYKVTKAVPENPDPPVYAISLDTVDGIVPGDRLEVLQSTRGQAVTILQVDADALEVVTREEVRGLSVNEYLFFTRDSLSELVFEDARAVINRAVRVPAPDGSTAFSVDLSRFQSPVLPVPVLTWLPLRPFDKGEDLTALRDIDCGLDMIRLYGSGSTAWDGTPEAGWARSATPGSRSIWTEQLVNAPASLMPDEQGALAPRSPGRNRPYDLRWRKGVRMIDVNGARSPDPTDTWDPGTASVAESVLLYDYLRMRRVLFTTTQVQVTPWTGTAWGATTTQAWAGVQSACVLPGTAGILALTTAGLQLGLLPGVSPVLAIPTDAKNGVLRSTPWGAYLVAERGYGRVTWNGSALALAWVSLADQMDALYPATLVGLDATEVCVCGRFEALDRQGKKTTETYLLRLAATPGDARTSVLWRERLLEGAPRTIGAVRDPSTPGRVLGHCGGRLWQLSRTLPAAPALERLKPGGMMATELIEYVCQVLAAVPVPTPDGVLHIISRSLLDVVIDLPVYIQDATEALAWEHRYTAVRVSSAHGDVYADVPAAGEVGIQGGHLLEVQRHPLIWTESGCEAMARLYYAWFSPRRRRQVQRWVWPDPNTPAPWESLPPLARVRLNGAPTVWMVMRMSDRRTKGEADVTLLEVG